MKIYQVGGCVRDTLLGHKPQDIDWLVVGATPEEMLQNGFIRVGADFPVFLHPQTHEEYALARKERKTSAGHKGFMTQFDPSVTLEEDLSRRDLTINAMALDQKTGQIFDPYGGQFDLKSKILRHVSNAFEEDPLRVLRLARFQARTGFSIDPNTFILCQKICKSGSLNELSKERICVEIRKILQCDNAAQAIQTLLDVGAIDSIHPQWSSRLNVQQLLAIEQAIQLDLPEWAKTRLMCCSSLNADDTLHFLENLRFPAECFKWASRLGVFCEWAKSNEIFASSFEAITNLLERCGASKMNPNDLESFSTAARLELTSLGIDSNAIAFAQKALTVAPSISSVDLSSALVGTKKELALRVKLAKTAAFETAFTSEMSNISKPKR